MKINWMERDLPREKYSGYTETNAAKPAKPRGEFKAWLDSDGRLRTRGFLPEHCSILELLVGLDASVQEIESHIGPIHHPRLWKDWTGTMLPYVKLMERT